MTVRMALFGILALIGSVSASAPAATPQSIAVLPFAPVRQSVDTHVPRAADLALLHSTLIQSLEQSGFALISPSRINGVLRSAGFNQTNPDLACVDMACAMRIARALNADAVLVGTARQPIGIYWRTDVAVYCVKSGKELAHYKGEVLGDVTSSALDERGVGLRIARLLRGRDACPSVR